MIFRPELADAVMAGTKTVTRRATSTNPHSPWWARRCDLKVGRTYAVCPGRGVPAVGRVRITAVELELFEPMRITEREARAEGFAGAADFCTTWRALHASLDAVQVWRVEFEVAT